MSGLVSLCALAVLAQVIIPPRSAFPQADFSQGKTVTVIISTAPGGTGDLRMKSNRSCRRS
jgi:hypothetical protein